MPHIISRSWMKTLIRRLQTKRKHHRSLLENEQTDSCDFLHKSAPRKDLRHRGETSWSKCWISNFVVIVESSYRMRSYIQFDRRTRSDMVSKPDIRLLYTLDRMTKRYDFINKHNNELNSLKSEYWRHSWPSPWTTSKQLARSRWMWMHRRRLMSRSATSSNKRLSDHPGEEMLRTFSVQVYVSSRLNYECECETAPNCTNILIRARCPGMIGQLVKVG